MISIGSPKELREEVRADLYRITQEAITNVISHANAREIDVQLAYSDGKIRLIVHDNGSGFDVEKEYKSNQYGLTGMKERAEMVGGELNITSKIGHGTTVQFLV